MGDQLRGGTASLVSNKLRFGSNCIEIECDRKDIEAQQMAMSLYPIHHNRINTLYKTSPYRAPEVLKLFRGLDADNIDTAPPRIQEIFYNEIQARENVVDILQNGARHNHVVNDRLTLKPHQQRGREIATYRDRYAFFYDTRTGKTPLSLTIIYDDLQAYPNHKWLIVCPLILIENAWLEDAETFFPEIKIVNCHATTPQGRLKKMSQEANIYVTNVESFAKYKENFEKMGFAGCIVDESSTMKSHKSNVSHALVDFAQTVKRFYLLSGTPAPNGEWEYYMQLKAIDYFGIHQSYTQFKEYFFIDVSYNQYEDLMVRPDRKDELYALIKRLACYVDKEDVLNTPGRTFIEVEFDLPPEVMKAYRLMKNELYMETQGKTITVKSAAAKYNKLNQISSGFVMDTQAIKENKFYADSNATEWYLLDNWRFKKLEEILESDTCRGEQVLIWANFRAEFEVIQRSLGERCRCIYGGTSINEKNEAIRLFKEGKIQYLVANPASADKGLTLTNAHIAMYFSLNWSYELFKQSMERIYADISKQPKHCLYYILIAKHTIDGVLYRDVLQGKKDSSTAVLNHLKS